MLAYFQEMFSYPFMVRAAIVGLTVSLCAALLGVSLVLKRYAMIGQGLSQVAFAALAIATAFNWTPLPVAIPVTVVAAFLILRVKERHAIHGDATLAMLSTVALAFGVLLISLSTGINTDVCNYLFGSILAASDQEVIFSLILLGVIILVYAFLYLRIFSLTFDEDFAQCAGLSTERLKAVLALLSGLVIVLGMRTVGTLLMSSLIVFPAMIALKLAKSFKMVLIFSELAALLCFVLGLWLSYAYAVPTGAGIAILNASLYALVYVYNLIARHFVSRKLV